MKVMRRSGVASDSGEYGSLARLRAGDQAVISGIADDRARAVALRFGMGAGAEVSCVSALPGGPVVLGIGRQEIAVGRGLARRISIETPWDATRG